METTRQSVLYLSYDGLTDPLGQSQILPYLESLCQKGFSFTILTCEKKEAFKKFERTIKDRIKPYPIRWVPISFSTKPPILSKFWDIERLFKTAEALHKSKPFAFIHCRSYVNAEVAVRMKNKYNLPWLFDMRGFWVDERTDGGLWDTSKLFYRKAYQWYKKRESNYISSANTIISLTEAGKKEIESWDSYSTQTPIKVIPCCCDFNIFKEPAPALLAEKKASLGYSENDLVISYLGTIGTWYMLNEMLDFYKQVLKTYPEAKFLFITKESPETIFTTAKERNVPTQNIKVTFAQRNEVPVYLASSNLHLFFVKQSYSKIASSPVKLGEALAMGIPIITNSKIGDVEQIVDQLEAGIYLEDFNEKSYARLIEQIPELLQLNKSKIIEKAREYYLLENGVNKYTEAYESVLNSTKG